MNMTEESAREVVEGMKRDGMPPKAQKKFLQFALKFRGHLFPAAAVAVYKQRIAEL